jgi:membrane-bound ClpP family serine protease
MKSQSPEYLGSPAGVSYAINRPLRRSWLAHVVLVLAAAAVSSVLLINGSGSLVHRIAAGLAAVMTILAATLAVLAWRAKQRLPAVAGYVCLALGSLCLFVSKLLTGDDVTLGFIIASGVLYGLALIGFILMLRGQRHRTEHR